MCVLQKRLAQGNSGDEIVPAGPVSSLLQTCVESASNILGTLKDLGDNDQLGMFSFFASTRCRALTRLPPEIASSLSNLRRLSLPPSSST